MFDSAEDIERSLDVIGSTVGLSTAAYSFVVIVGSSNPSLWPVVGATVGLLWAGRAVYKSLQ
jgi:hypothetical protein